MTSTPRSQLVLFAAALGFLWLLRRPPQTDQGMTSPVASHYVNVGATSVHILAANYEQRNKATVVLLHGQAFQAATWQGTGTLDALSQHGVRAIAVDLPGHGVTGGQALPADSRPAFLADLLKALQVGQPLVVISPSMSGSYVLPWLREHATELAGWVAVAPVGLKQWAADNPLPADSQSKLKVLAIYGERDGMKADYAALEDAAPRAQFLLIPNAGHACYMDAPDLFNRELLRFLDNEILSG